MNIKPGASVAGLQPEILIALMVAREVYRDHGNLDRFTITSGTDHHEKRQHTTLHHNGYAVDLRLPSITDLNHFVNDLKYALGHEYDVVREVDHIHVEYQP